MPLSIKKNLKYTYRDYLTWPEDERRELIEGAAYNMAPAPTTQHQQLVWEINGQIYNYLLSKKECLGFTAPFDVRLSESDDDNDIETVVQPDIVVICDSAKIDKKGCKGSPDFIIEITSPSTASRDHIQKVALYEKYGVPEYWIIDPVNNIITIRLLENDKKYGIPKLYEAKGTGTK